MDKDIVLNKLESLRRCIQRIQDKTPPSSHLLVEDYDLQDIITLNLERSVQLCVDIGLHIISDLEVPVPDTMAKTFVVLEQANCLDGEVADRMIKSVGFRNTAVHAYQEIDWNIVYRIITEHLDDFRAFSRQILSFMQNRG
ncbi:type VII toxin-antitoxin system HepT family RNase toxin [Desulfurispira natronophila]|uniref:Uncharacterized protein YutE (UPF0331/DUF86 family) n=1 Tax=Desulfurispira natronophila TaxID=682562 RepID=A0A7W7Y6B1_9BACT|nr:DUF86 domain-containing protein [Desulfurispira natronophila]MBB5022864.1 uncharacterized protein YutE (UPF0331/DUF86 family) [Desulfurispira natronophila]